MKLSNLSLLAILLSLAFISCKRNPPVDYGGFPPAIGEILVTNCSRAGCHDDNSLNLEGRLSLTGWDKLFQGSRSGAAVIPFSPGLSFLPNFINTNPALGIIQAPTMPVNADPLSDEQVTTVINWIAAGAPNEDGVIPFSGDPNRKKVYITNQGCDLMAVVDKETGLVMRYISVGSNPAGIESPHNVKVSPDGQFWYVIFINNPVIEKYRTSDDAFVERYPLEPGGDYNTFTLSPNGRYAFCVATFGGFVSIVDLENPQIPAVKANIGLQIHGSVLHPGGGKLYIPRESESKISVLEFSDPMSPDNLDEFDLVQHIPAAAALRPHELAFTPDGSKYLVTCQGTDEVRFYQSSNDSLLLAIHVGNLPVEISLSATHGLAFITCMEDTSMVNYPIERGAVAVIDYENMSLIKHIYTGYQPHGIFVDDESGLVYVANRNLNVSGPIPHHTSDCGGRNGYLTIIDLNTLELLPGYKAELSPDPYSVAIRF